MLSKSFLLFFTFISIYTQAVAQNFFFKIQNKIPVKIDKKLINAWAGGLNSPQFSTMDLNFDKVEDLVIFERTSSKVLTFLGNKNTKTYQYAPEYVSYFPQNIVGWLLLRDYNQDGKKDIFAKSSLGVRVYKNISNINEGLQWELITETITSKGYSGQINLQVPVTDIPSIVDLDDDGDLDILTFDITGGFIEFHQNQSQEKYHNAEKLEFTKTSTCWGGIQELADCGEFNFGVSCLLENESEEKGLELNPTEIFHVGSSLLVLDLNGDGLKDACLGDVSCQPIYRLINEGSNTSASFPSASTNFPRSKPINFYLFPALFWEDINFDGKKDLLASPNTFSNEANLVNFQESVWLYQNQGTHTKPNFIHQQDNFLQAQMLDLGENLSPSFVDFDVDGDLDLLIGNRGNIEHEQFYGKLYYFENTGNKEKPSFELKDADFLNISEKRWTEIRPTFQDINGDKIPDLLITANNLTETKLYFIPNQASSKQRFSFDLNDLQKVDIPMARYDFPLLLDTDQDNDLDLLIGKTQGNLVYYKNIGNDKNPEYQLVTKSLGNIKRNTRKRSLTLAIADINGDNKLDLLTGDRSGFLNIYHDFLNKMEDSWESENKIVSNKLMNTYQTYKFGTVIFPSLADLNQDGLPEIILGTNTGGLHYLENKSQNNIQIQAPKSQVILKPNPIIPDKTSNRYLHVLLIQDSEVQIFDMKNKAVNQKQKVFNNQVTSILVDYLASGAYILKIENNLGTQSERFIISR